MRRGFGSDNHSGVHPKIFDALQSANDGHEPSYGTDAASERVQKIFKRIFGPQSQTFFVFNGTAANVLSISSMMESFNAAIVSDVSHLAVDECGAPEFFSGGKLLPLPHQQGKLRLEDIEASLIRRGDQHFSQAKVISLTQPTELGTVYEISEIKRISDFAHRQGLYVHVDGARLANAAVHLKKDIGDLVTAGNIDVLSLGGTKNGFLFGEAIVFLNPVLADNFKYRRKQAAQLPSKTRFIAAQFEAYFENDLWKEIATHQCEMAERLFSGLSKLSTLEITQARQSNAVFIRLPQPLVKQLRETFFFYVWDEKTFECRLMTSWDTTEADVDGFISLVKELL